MEYHQRTSYDRHDMSPHFLDWENQPYPFKNYPGPNPIPLPKKVSLPQKSVFRYELETRSGDIEAGAFGIEADRRLMRAKADGAVGGAGVGSTKLEIKTMSGTIHLRAR